MNNSVMFSSKSDMWATPKDFFDKLNEEFHFDLDPCASESNHKCEKYFTEETDGLAENWGGGTAYFATHLIAILKSGLRSVMKNRASLER